MNLRFLTRSAVLPLSIAILAAFAAQVASDRFTIAGMFIPQLALAEPWRWVTSAFLHGGFYHLFFNLFALYLFGVVLENQIGSRKVLALFFGGAIAGDVGYLATGGTAPALGASGAVYTLMGALAVLQPRLPLSFFFGPPLPLIAWVFIWAALDVFRVFTPSTIAGGAHLGGLALGLWAGFYFRRPRQPRPAAEERAIVAPRMRVKAPPREGARFECRRCGYVATHFSEIESPRCPGCGEPTVWRPL
ncbi:MAG: rhomboid family intramembrane serine protease [Halobacteria archaeon]